MQGYAVELVVPGCCKKVRGVVYETFQFKQARAGIEPGLAALVLLERMQLAQVKQAALFKHLLGLLKDEAQVFNIFQHQATGDQVELRLAEGLGFPYVQLPKFDVGSLNFGLGFL